MIRRRKFIGLGLGLAATTAFGARADAGTSEAGSPVSPNPLAAPAPSTPEPCTRTFCFLTPQWWIQNSREMLSSTIYVDGVLHSTRGQQVLYGLKLGTGSVVSNRRRLNAHFIAAQLSHLRFRGALAGNQLLGCTLATYGFKSAVSLSASTITPNTTLQELWSISLGLTSNSVPLTSVTLPVVESDSAVVVSIFSFLQDACGNRLYP